MNQVQVEKTYCVATGEELITDQEAYFIQSLSCYITYDLEVVFRYLNQKMDWKLSEIKQAVNDGTIYYTTVE
ncbi:hypothetical protein [Cytobacillus kochii]|uniref:hypothetical protein n=1 Tax=Cytobacillus kochii TaxID=859143 RepID=UPI0024802C1D|nr:hypothetical protein [Cytobacillus kochii]